MSSSYWLHCMYQKTYYGTARSEPSVEQGSRMICVHMSMYYYSCLLNLFHYRQHHTMWPTLRTSLIMLYSISLVTQDHLQGRVGSFSSSLPIFSILVSCQLIHPLKDICAWVMPKQEGLFFSQALALIWVVQTGIVLLDQVSRDRWGKQESTT